MHDLKYPNELLLKVHSDLLIPIVQHGEGTIFANAATGFRDSMEQIRQLIWLPEFIVRSTAVQIMFDVASMYEAIGEPLPRQLTPEQWKKVTAVKERKLQEESSITDRSVIEARLQKELSDSMLHLRRICSLEEGNPQTLSAVGVFAYIPVTSNVDGLRITINRRLGGITQFWAKVISEKSFSNENPKWERATDKDYTNRIYREVQFQSNEQHGISTKREIRFR